MTMPAACPSSAASLLVPLANAIPRIALAIGLGSLTHATARPPWVAAAVSLEALRLVLRVDEPCACTSWPAALYLCTTVAVYVGWSLAVFYYGRVAADPLMADRASEIFDGGMLGSDVANDPRPTSVAAPDDVPDAGKEDYEAERNLLLSAVKSNSGVEDEQQQFFEAVEDPVPSLPPPSFVSAFELGHPETTVTLPAAAAITHSMLHTTPATAKRLIASGRKPDVLVPVLPQPMSLLSPTTWAESASVLNDLAAWYHPATPTTVTTPPPPPNMPTDFDPAPRHFHTMHSGIPSPPLGESFGSSALADRSAAGLLLRRRYLDAAASEPQVNGATDDLSFAHERHPRSESGSGMVDLGQGRMESAYKLLSTATIRPAPLPPLPLLATSSASASSSSPTQQ
ncbi:hypothetical protein BC828DRAFT_378195 [Blastocladiella britannica]|nr:hypothetical protein BC828DRAFT_378195 [Blastocladiella britannica]